MAAVGAGDAQPIIPRDAPGSRGGAALAHTFAIVHTFAITHTFGIAEDTGTFGIVGWVRDALFDLCMPPTRDRHRAEI